MQSHVAGVVPAAALPYLADPLLLDRCLTETGAAELLAGGPEVAAAAECAVPAGHAVAAGCAEAGHAVDVPAVDGSAGHAAPAGQAVPALQVVPADAVHAAAVPALLLSATKVSVA